MKRFILLLLALSLSACGFHLRGHKLKGEGFPFTSLHLKFSAQTPFISELQSSLDLYEIKQKVTPAEADLTLDIVSEASNKVILAVSGAGLVREYQLNYRVSLRAFDKKQVEWLPADEITLQRTLRYDDTQVLAREQEEGLLTRDMRADAVQQVMRRLSHAKPHVEQVNQAEPAK
jgi:LPS-assembly lipoprotein